MTGPPRVLSFVWWNLHNFAHFDIAKISHERWPKSQKDYDAKRDRILEALREVFGKRNPHLLAFCEITREAAQDLASSISALSNPSAVQTKAMAQMGLTSIDVAKNLGKNGLSGTFETLAGSIMAHMGPARTRERSRTARSSRSGCAG